MRHPPDPVRVEVDHPANRNPYAPLLVAAGKTFDVIQVDEALGRATLEVLRARGIAPGPTIFDRRYRRIGFLIPPEAVNPLPVREQRSGPRHHGQGSWITIPRPNALPTDALVWLVEPVNEPDGRAPCTLRTLRRAIREAAQPPPR
ncbi:hypothetical protein [Streptomyces sp. SID3343]|uniref:hypothetical protein n=1 Tax=Streptomyces sp. SID3343 TaxID=2690260 RepID=UPI00136A9F2A|nr:hypothetical protein [Streptomyces sp. SID3343]MYV98947.1 hypothetical protein [Streptomyces sp. SID3343]